MADFLARLRLDDHQFNENIERSRRQTERFKGVQGAVTGAIGKFAGILGVAGGAMEVFNKLMKSSQTFGDNMTIAINAGKDSVDEFFSAISTGDFSSFLNGIENIINKSKDATAALDQLGNTKISYGYVRNRNRREIAEAKIIANNKKLSDSEREDGFDAWNKGLDKLRTNAHNLENDIIEAVKAMSVKGTALNNPSMDNIRYIAELDVNTPSFRFAEKDKLSKKYEEYEKKLKEYNVKPQSMWVIIDGVQKLLNMDEYRAHLAKQYEKSILYNNLLVKKNDEEWNSIVNYLIEADNINEELGSQQEEYNNALREFGNASGKVIQAQKKSAPGFGNIDYWYNNQDATMHYFNNQLGDVKQSLEEEANKYFSKHPIQFGVDLIPMVDRKGLSSNRGVAIESKDDAPIESNIDSINEYASALGAASQAILAFNSTKFEDNGEGIAQWASSTLGAVASTMSALMALASAKGVSSAMDLPFPANLAALFTVISTIASVFLSFPKFAEGGIVGSTLTTGDRNLARVNGGEMILNKGQQYNLFKLINRGVVGDPNSNNQVTFKIQGKELVGVLSNYNNKINKVL